MLVSSEGVPLKTGGSFPIATMRAVYVASAVEEKLTKLPPKDHESLRSTYERMLEK